MIDLTKSPREVALERLLWAQINQTSNFWADFRNPALEDTEPCENLNFCSCEQCEQYEG